MECGGLSLKSRCRRTDWRISHLFRRQGYTLMQGYRRLRIETILDLDLKSYIRMIAASLFLVIVDSQLEFLCFSSGARPDTRDKSDGGHNVPHPLSRGLASLPRTRLITPFSTAADVVETLGIGLLHSSTLLKCIPAVMFRHSTDRIVIVLRERELPKQGMDSCTASQVTCTFLDRAEGPLIIAPHPPVTATHHFLN